MKPRKVLYVSPNSRKGGAEQLTALMARFHDRGRWEPEFFFFADGPFVDEVRGYKIPCHTSQYPKPPRLRNLMSVWQSVHELKEIIRANDIDLVHSIMGYGHIFGGLAAQAAKVHEVWYQHGPTGELDWLTGLVPTDELFVNSQHTLQAQSRYRARARKTKILLPGIDLAGAMKNSPVRVAASSKITIGLFGRISPMKGHGLLLEAVAKLKKSGLAVTCVFSGEPFAPGDEQYAKDLRADVKMLGLEKDIIFAGFVREVSQLMASCQVVVNCSITPEPFGLTVVEAMSLGVAVVAPRAGGPGEVITDGKDGLLFQENSSDDLCAKLRLLATSVELREKLGLAARQKVREQYGITRMVRELEAEYDGLFSQEHR